MKLVKLLIKRDSEIIAGINAEDNFHGRPEKRRLDLSSFSTIILVEFSIVRTCPLYMALHLRRSKLIKLIR